LGGYGLPAASEPRKRWRGVRRPSVLDAGEPPLWSTADSDGLIDALPDAGEARFRALLDLLSGAYQIRFDLDADALAEEISSATPDVSAVDELFTRYRMAGRYVPRAAAELALCTLSDTEIDASYIDGINLFLRGEATDRLLTRFDLQTREHAALDALDVPTDHRVEQATKYYGRWATRAVKARLLRLARASEQRRIRALVSELEALVPEE